MIDPNEAFAKAQACQAQIQSGLIQSGLAGNALTAQQLNAAQLGHGQQTILQKFEWRLEHKRREVANLEEIVTLLRVTPNGERLAQLLNSRDY